jgi:hypothetical protein
MVLLIKTYNILNHLHSLSPHVHDDLWYVHLLLFGGLAQSYVNGNQCPRPTNSSTVKNINNMYLNQRIWR